MRVPIKRTPITPAEACELFQSAKPTAGSSTVRLLLALWDLETNGGKSMWNYNFGNIIAVSKTQRHFAATDAGNPRIFRDYMSAEEGAEALVTQLTKESRRWWRNGLFTGDPEEFVRALNGQRGGPAYFEANFDSYLKGFMARWEKYEVLPQKTAEETAEFEPEIVPEEIPDLTDAQVDELLTIPVTLKLTAEFKADDLRRLVKIFDGEGS